MRPLVKKASFLIATTGATAVVGYSFHFMASRYLGPARYGAYTALMALMLAFARPLEALSPLVARVMVENKHQDWKFFLRSFFHLAWIAGLALGGALFIFCLLWGHYLGLPLSIATLFAGLTLIFWSFLFVFRGVLQGHYKDEPYLLNRPIELLGRLISGTLFFAAGGGLAAAIFASLLGALAGIAHIFAVIRNSLSGWRDFWKGGVKPKIFTQFLKIMLIWLAGGFFIGADMIFVKRIFSPEESGMYAIANLIGKGVLVYASIILPLLYPRLVKHRLRRESWRYLGMGILYSSGIFLASFLLFFWWGKTIIPLFFGEAYREAAGLVPLYLIAIFPLALNFIVINLGSAVGDWSECAFFWATLGFYLLVLLFSPPQIPAYLWRIGITQALCAAGGFVFLLWREKK